MIFDETDLVGISMSVKEIDDYYYLGGYQSRSCGMCVRRDDNEPCGVVNEGFGTHCRFYPIENVLIKIYNGWANREGDEDIYHPEYCILL